MICWLQWHNLPDHLSSMLHKCFLEVICTLCCSWVLQAVCPCVWGTDPSGWVTLWVNLNNCAETLQGLSPEAKLFPAGSGACQNPPLSEPLLWLVGSNSGIVWSPPLVVLALVPLKWGSHCRSQPATVYDRPWVTCLQLPHCLWLTLLSLTVWGSLCTF